MPGSSGGVAPNIYAVFDAQSEAKLAVSAIGFSDKERAVAHLRKALALLAAS